MLPVVLLYVILDEVNNMKKILCILLLLSLIINVLSIYFLYKSYTITYDDGIDDAISKEIAEEIGVRIFKEKYNFNGYADVMDYKDCWWVISRLHKDKSIVMCDGTMYQMLIRKKDGKILVIHDLSIDDKWVLDD